MFEVECLIVIGVVVGFVGLFIHGLFGKPPRRRA